MSGVFVCHGVEWFDGEKCIGCQIAEVEQERIIKLLDQKHLAHENDATHNKSGECLACELIALIKGENK